MIIETFGKNVEYLQLFGNIFSQLFRKRKIGSGNF